MRNGENRIIQLFLLLSVAICLGIWVIAGNLPRTAVTSKNGVWDLRGIDFDSVSVKLEGDVEYVTEALLSSEHFAASGDILLGVIPDGIPYLTSRVRLLVPDDQLYEVAGFVDDFGSRIYVNGKWLTDSGRPSDSKENNIPMERFLRFTAEPKDGMIEILQQTSNFVFRSNTSHTGWAIGRPEAVDRWTSGLIYSYNINMGFYLALFLVHLLLLVLLPSYRANLWFSLLCLVWAVRTGIVRVRPLVILLQIGWAPALRAEYLTVLAALVLITLAYSFIFPRVLHKNLCNVMFALSGCWALVYLFADTLFISRTVIWLELVAGTWTAYIIFSIVSKLKQIDFKQKIIIAGLGIILIALVLDTLYYNNVFLPFMHNVLMETAVVIFSLFQMTAMFLGTMEEVAAAREAEQKLALENAALDRVNRLKTDMMATVSHEMRTPLAVMMGYAQLTAAELKDKGIDEQATADLDAMALEAQRLAQLVEEIQNVSVSQQFEKGRQSAPADAVILQITRLYAPILERKQTRLKVSLQENLPPVSCSPNEFTQVLFNLLNNADKHTKDGDVKVTAALDGDKVSITVSDTGTGIAPELLPYVFERYRHGEGSGIGLGLAICKEIVEARGGNITIESILGKGTAVHFTLLTMERR